jgi:hypothetical protein
MNENSTFTVHHLRFEVEATTPLVLPPPAGPKLRAALYGALGMVCPMRGDANAPPEHKAACPVCWLLATERPGDRGGKDLPRPVTVEPPLDLRRARLQPGERFSFGLSLFAQAANLFPYLALGVPEMGRRGLGQRLPELDGRRGRFELRRAEAVNPLTGERQCLLDAAQGPLFQVPNIPVTQAQVREESERMANPWPPKRSGVGGERRIPGPRSEAEWGANGERRIPGPRSEAEWGANGEWRITVHFLTPMRIVSEGRLVHTPHFPPLFARLFDRLQALSTHYADGGLVPGDAKPGLMALADRVRLAGGEGTWREARSYSRRLGRSTPLGGFIGRVVYQAPLQVWRPLLPYLLWGQSVHVGKSATRGDGWYELRIANGE